MKNLLKCIGATAIALVIMLAFRALALTIYTVPDKGLEPSLLPGDRILVNRWSYGLRTGGFMFEYSRWLKSDIHIGDMAVFNNPLDTLHRISARDVFVCPVKAIPGDTVVVNKRAIVIPGRHRMVRVDNGNAPLLCATYNLHEHRHAFIRDSILYVDGKATHCASFSQDYYWMGTTNKNSCTGSLFFGLIPESLIIGRAVAVVYNKNPQSPFYNGYNRKRYCLAIK
jgi:signal peptidase I